MMVQMGVDRIHHGFWKYHDPTHAKYEPGSKYEKRFGLLSLSRPEDRSTSLMSRQRYNSHGRFRHGAKSMVGGVCVNEWMIQNGYFPSKRSRGCGSFWKSESGLGKDEGWEKGLLLEDLPQCEGKGAGRSDRPFGLRKGPGIAKKGIGSHYG